MKLKRYNPEDVKVKKTIKFGEEKHSLCALRLAQIVSSLQSSKTDIHLKIKTFISFLDQALPALSKNLFDIPELQGMWRILLKSHSQLLLGWELTTLPKISAFKQLIGFYKYVIARLSSDKLLKLDLLMQATEQGSINAMIAL